MKNKLKNMFNYLKKIFKYLKNFYLTSVFLMATTAILIKLIKNLSIAVGCVLLLIAVILGVGYIAGSFGPFGLILSLIFVGVIIVSFTEYFSCEHDYVKSVVSRKQRQIKDTEK